jgi:hypothetical protein
LRPLCLSSLITRLFLSSRQPVYVNRPKERKQILGVDFFTVLTSSSQELFSSVLLFSLLA